MSRITWDLLREIGEIRALGTCYFFFITVPIVAKLFSLVPEKIVIPFSSFEIPITLSLPFSWMLFFWAAFFVSIGLTVYKLYCPRIIAEFSNYEEFANSKRSGLFFQSVFYSLVDTKDTDMKRVIENVNSRYDNNFDVERTNNVLAGNIDVSSDFFYATRDLSNISKLIPRLACFLAYAIGLSLILIVMLQNVLFVIKY